VWADYVNRMTRHGRRVTVLTGASMFPARDDRDLVRALKRRVAGPLEVIDAVSAGEWLDAIARAAVVVSGRFHHTIAAATLGTPFVLVESNTPKNAGLARMLDAAPPLALGRPGLVDDLVSRTEEAIQAGPRPPDSHRAQVARLCALAEKNFLGLAAGAPRERGTAG
jgi:polysaccharide pyruvyl transferase WcaK-like protein